MSVEVKCLPIGLIETNCYVLWQATSRKAMIVDCGGDADQVVELVRQNDLTPELLVNTHGHADHIAGNEDLKKAFPDIELCIHEDDAVMLRRPLKNLSLLFGLRLKSPPPDRTLKDGDVLELAGIRMEVMHTPGHSPGGICLYLPRCEELDAPILFSGDTLFMGSVGRTDFPGSSMKALQNSIDAKLKGLPPETKVYPGHGPATVLEQEFAHNPFIQR